jgi:hypothetical protein
MILLVSLVLLLPSRYLFSLSFWQIAARPRGTRRTDMIWITRRVMWKEEERERERERERTNIQSMLEITS